MKVTRIYTLKTILPIRIKIYFSLKSFIFDFKKRNGLGKNDSTSVKKEARVE